MEDDNNEQTPNQDQNSHRNLVITPREGFAEDIQIDQKNIVPPVPMPTPNGHKEKFNKSIFIVYLSEFLIGLSAMFLVGLILGLAFNEKIVSHSQQYFGSLGDALSLMYIMPFVFLLFAIIALVTRTFTYLFYPIIAFYIANLVLDTSIVSLIAQNIRSLPPEGKTQFFNYAIAITIAYMLIYTIDKSIRILLRAERQKNLDRTVVITSSVLMSLAIVIFPLSNAIARPMAVKQQRDRASVAIPNDKLFIGETKKTYDLITSKEETKTNNSRLRVAQVSVASSEKWWESNARSVCGDQFNLNNGSSKVYKNTFKKTPNNFEYAEATYTMNASNVPAKTNEYNVYLICFAIGSQTYTVERNGLTHGDSISKYDTASVVDSIYKAQKYLISCEEKNKPKYCKQEDISKLQSLNSSFKEVNAVTVSTNKKSENFILNKNAYSKIGDLAIPEWGIKVPLTEHIRDAYYAIGKSDPKNGDFIIVALKSVDTGYCYAGERNHIDGEGIAYVHRKKNDKGGYDYSVYTNGNLTNCVKKSGNGNLSELDIKDSFVWSNANISQ